MQKDNIGNLEVRNGKGDRVPLQTLVNVRDDSGPAVVNHYNMYPSAEINGNTAPGVSSGQAIAIMDHLAANELPSTMGSALDRADATSKSWPARTSSRSWLFRWP